MAKLYLTGRFGRYAPRSTAETAIAMRQAAKRARDKVFRDQTWPCKNGCGATGRLEYSGCCCADCEAAWRAKVESGEIWLQVKCLYRRCKCMCTLEHAPYRSDKCRAKVEGE